MSEARVIDVNRAPVMTLWAVVVAERLGHGRELALTLGKAVAGLNAQSKGRRLGIYEPKPADTKRKRTKSVDETIDVLHRAVPVTETPEGLRALSGDQVLQPKAVESYLKRSFGDHLPEVEAAMCDLAKKFTPQELADVGYDLYEQFRPSIPGGKKGWGARGQLDLDLIRSLRA